ncbi:MAG TPA: YidC/Oxa1 family insertase periplasmic-domain containing protein [Opitutaceae bacterium]|nr:YidC/Oxa1 family insertase periplasmic-domain containing protein [Opitutaceae bacterium]
MDKKNLTIGVVLLIAAFAMIIFAPKTPQPTQPANAQSATTSSKAPAAAAAGAPTTAQGQPVAVQAPATSAAIASGPFASIHKEVAGATITTLQNDFIEVRLTNHGGAVRDVAFRKHAAVQGKSEPYVFNLLHEDPILALTDYPRLGRDSAYEVASSSPTEVVFRAVLDERVEVTRRYRLMKEGEPGADPYRIHHETTFRNLTDAVQTMPVIGLSVGTATLINSSDLGQHLNVVAYDGEKPHFLERSELEGGGFGAMFGSGKPVQSALDRPGKLVWAAAKNQFFASIYTPDQPGAGVRVRRIELPPFPDNGKLNIGITGAARFEVPALAAKTATTLSGNLYVGPQEYKRLAKFEHNEGKVLPYTQYFFNRIFLSGYVAPFLNILLNATHSWVGNWGVAVILMTLILKIVSLPFTLAASKSAKRMAKLQPLMQEIREKYKDNPQKQQMATMELFKTHKVNPVGGCIPVLITFPLFIGFFAMLQGTAELRFQPFLWAHDLSASDTVGYIFGLPINIMPLLMGATMYFQMRLTPTPSVDNMQMKMMRFMPVIFTMFCYGFSCALSLYSTINGLFTIVQQIVINKMKDDDAGPVSPGTAAATTAAAWKKGTKNITPKDKKLK